MLRLGVVQYINALPFHARWKRAETPHFDHPSTLNHLLAERKLDGALTSSLAFLSGPYEMLPFGIASDGEVMSVHLYYTGRLTHAKRILIPAESASSVALLKVLCHYFWNLHPTFVLEDQDCDGYLLMGDAALKHTPARGMTRIDLGSAWKQETGYPFVFALWLAHKGVALPPLQEALTESLLWAERHPDTLVEQAGALSFLPRPLLEKYFKTLIYRIGKRELEGLTLFWNLYKGLDVPSTTA